MLRSLNFANFSKSQKTQKLVPLNNSDLKVDSIGTAHTYTVHTVQSTVDSPHPVWWSILPPQSVSHSPPTPSVSTQQQQQHTCKHNNNNNKTERVSVCVLCVCERERERGGGEGEGVEREGDLRSPRTGCLRA